MTFRTRLVGTERGVVLGVVLGFLAAGLVGFLDPALEPPFPSGTAGYWLVLVAYTLPAVVVGAYEGGIVAAWVAQTLPALAIWTSGDGFVVYPFGLGPLGFALLAGVSTGTLGWGVGQVLGAVWSEAVGEAVEPRD